jgi:hypothetical protein
MNLNTVSLPWQSRPTNLIVGTWVEAPDTVHFSVVGWLTKKSKPIIGGGPHASSQRYILEVL